MSNIKHKDPIVRPSELREELGASKTTIWRWTRDGSLPKPLQLGKRNTGWPRSVIDKFKVQQGWPVTTEDNH